MRGFGENVQKPDFKAKNGQKWQKLAIFGQNLENENFFQKSAWNIFLVSPRCNFRQSFRKIWCADLQISRHARTNARTDERESIGPSANAERPKISKKHQRFERKWPKTAQNHIMSPHAMYFWPQNGQNDQNKNFPRHNTTVKWLKAIVSSFWPSYVKFW